MRAFHNATAKTAAPAFLAAGLLIALPWACRSDDTRHDDTRGAASADQPLQLVDAAAFANWQGDPRFWSFANGSIVGRSTNEVPCDATTYLVWRGGEVEDFEVEFEYRIQGGNSGLQFRSADAGQWQVAGFQADIEDGPNWSGCLYEQDGRGVVARRGERVQLEAGARRAENFGSREQLDAAARSGAWNRYRVRAVGALVELELNGVKTVEVLDLDPERFRARGLLALQLHAGGPMTIEVRSLKLTHLAAPAAPPTPWFAAESALGVEVDGPGAGAPPQWIWSGPQPRDGELVAFQRRVQAPAELAAATLRATADNRLRVFVNGQLALTNDDWSRVREADLRRLLRPGENVITALATNEGGPAGAWFELALTGAKGARVRLVSDASWSAQRVEGVEFASWDPKSFDAARGGAPHVFGPFGIQPWGAAASSSSADAPKEEALAADQLEIPDGFAAELLYSVPKGEQGSWVTMCEAPGGRLYVSDQYGALYRVTPPPLGSSAPTQVEKVALELGGAQGLCWAFDALYVVVAESSQHKPGFYRCRDSDGDGALDTRELLREFEGGGEHGPHAVVLGPDQRLWIVGGNHTKLPEPIDASWAPRTWGEDLLLPRIDDPNGHAVGVMAPGGWIVRTDENAQRWELWAIGFRNAYDIAFSPSGALYTFDSDMEWDVGLPWYRPARVCVVPPGADFGWRHGSGKWPNYYVDSAPATCDIGLASPTGVAFATNSKFEGKYKSAFYAADWAYGKVYAVWGERFEPFISGKPFPVTDLVFASDGALYVTTGGRRTQSGLYRVTSRQDAQPQPNARTRPVEKQLDAWLASPRSPDAPPPTDQQLADAVRRLGQLDPEARTQSVLIERASAEQLVKLLETTSDVRHVGALAAAAIRAAPQATRELVVRRLSEHPLSNVGELYRLDVLRAMGLALLRLELDDATRAAWRDKLSALYPYGMERTDRELAQLLAHLGDTRIIEPALAELALERPQEDKLWRAYCLRALKGDWTVGQRRRLLEFLDGEAREFAGGHSLKKYVERMRADFVEGFSAAEREALADVLEPRASAAAAAAPAASFVHAWTREELAPHVAQPLRGRDFERGRTAFAKARCTECHRLGGEGGATGPDLTGSAGRFSRLDLLDALLTPSAAISDQYQDTEVLTRDGDLFVGRVEGEANGVLKLRRLPPSDEVLELELASIESRRLHPLSRMPSGLVDVLEREELLDLLAYVLAGGERSDAAFEQH
jgi:putative heme-binding domain-containing protein